MMKPTTPTPPASLKYRVQIWCARTMSLRHAGFPRRAALALATLLSAATPAMAVERVFVVTANGSDTQDDTASIKATFTAAQTAVNTIKSSRASAAIIFPQGRYYINERLALDIYNAPKYGAALMIRGAGSNQTIIQSTSATGQGALLVTVKSPHTNGNDVQINIEDLCFTANRACVNNGAGDSGAAIEIMPYNATIGDSNSMPTEGDSVPSLTVIPNLSDVAINRTNSGAGFTYGFKAYQITRSKFNRVVVDGNPASTIAGLHFTHTYGGEVSDCAFSNATYGWYSKYAGEGGAIIRSTMANVDEGLYVDMDGAPALMSNSGGSMRNCTVSARQRAVYFNHKRFLNIVNNRFAPPANATSGYKDIELKASGYCYIHSNVFSQGGPSGRTGLSLAQGTGNLDDTTLSNFVHDNDFSGISGTWVEVGNGSIETMIFNNGMGTAGHVADQGLGTWIADGASQPRNSAALSTPFSQRFHWSDVPISGTNVFNVKAAPYNAKATGSDDDTQPVANAAAAMIAYLNGAPNRSAFLYFPAGTYKITGRIAINQTGVAWGNVTLHGDGAGVTTLLADANAGAFDINMATEHTPVQIHNLSLVAQAPGTGTAVKIAQKSFTGTTEPSSLYMHNVDIVGQDNGDYFKIGVSGNTLKYPRLDDVKVYMADLSVYNPAPAGTIGVQMKNVQGLECNAPTYKKRLEKGLEVTCNSSVASQVIIRSGGAPVGPDTGIWIDGAGKAGVAIEGTHTNCIDRNIAIQNAVYVDCAHMETLNYDWGSRAGMGTIYLHDCDNATIRDNTFWDSAGTYNILRRVVEIDGGSVAPLIYANHFREPGDYFVWLHSNTASPAILYNRFARTHVHDISGPNSKTVARTYELEGENTAYYLLRNRAANKYLGAGGALVNCTASDITDAVQWKITAVDKTRDRFILENKAGGLLTLSGATGVTLAAGAPPAQGQKWTFAKQASGTYKENYSLRCLGNNKLLQSDSNGAVDCNGSTLSSATYWEAIRLDDLVKGWDHSSFTANVSAADPGAWHGVNFMRPFPFPPAVYAGGPGTNETDALTVRIRNITTTGFEFKLDEWGTNGNHTDEMVGFIAVHRGAYNIYPSISFDSGVIPAVRGDNIWYTQNFTTPFATGVIPVVFAMTTSTNDNSTVCTRVRDVSETSFRVKLQGASNATAAHGQETVNYIAFEPSTLTGNNEARNGYQADLTQKIVTQDWSPISFSLDNRDDKDIGFISGVQTWGGADPCATRFTSLNATAGTVEVKVDEDPSAGTPAHGAEQIGWMVFENY